MNNCHFANMTVPCSRGLVRASYTLSDGTVMSMCAGHDRAFRAALVARGVAVPSYSSMARTTMSRVACALVPVLLFLALLAIYLLLWGVAADWFMRMFEPSWYHSLGVPIA